MNRSLSRWYMILPTYQTLLVGSLAWTQQFKEQVWVIGCEMWKVHLRVPGGFRVR